MSGGAFKRIGIYGIGNFGYALLRLLAPKAASGVCITAFDRNEEVRRLLRDERRHPDFDVSAPLEAEVRIVDDPAVLARESDLLILAAPSDATRDVIGALRPALAERSSIILMNTAKALDAASGRLLSDVVAENLGGEGPNWRYAVFSGGTIAADMLGGQPLGATVACSDRSFLQPLSETLSSPSLWIQTTDDVRGVQLAGAFKNIVSICAGMTEGLGLAYGAETHLISRLSDEVAEFCISELGAAPSTFALGSQCWGNDMWMSCTGPTRNRALGRLIGSGRLLEEAEREMRAARKTVEGAQTVRALDSIFERYPDALPLLRVARSILLHDAPAQSLFDALMCGQTGVKHESL